MNKQKKIAKNYVKRIRLGTSDAWSMRQLPQQLSDPAYFVEDCHIFTAVPFFQLSVLTIKTLCDIKFCYFQIIIKSSKGVILQRIKLKKWIYYTVDMYLKLLKATF